MSVDVAAVARRLGIVPDPPKPVSGELWAKCPSGKHRDNRPSWSIRVRGAKAGRHNCLSCAFGGTLVDLVAHVLGFSGDDDRGVARALAWLGSEAVHQPPVELPAGVTVEVRQRSAPVFALPPEVLPAAPLDAWPSSVRDYVTGRGITPAQVARWDLRYALSGRLSGRVVIPIRDLRGRLSSYVARDFTGRSDPKDSKVKRFLYASRAEGIDNDVMFGEAAWPAATRGSRVFVTEAAIDALAVERATGGHVAALGGAQVRPNHAERLARFSEVVVVTDPDPAGDEAASLILAYVGRHARVVRARPPAGFDAAKLPLNALRRLLWSRLLVSRLLATGGTFLRRG